MFLENETPPADTDERELAILTLLRDDPHASNREISERLELSISQVATAIRSIELRNCAHVLAVLDVTKFGIRFAALKIKVRGRNLDQVAHDLAELRAMNHVAAMAGSEYDLLAFVRYRTIGELTGTIWDNVAGIEGVTDLSLLIALDTLSFRIDYMSYVAEFFPTDSALNLANLREETDELLLDELDRTIIAELQTDGRRTIQAIAQNTGVKAGTIRYRIRSLEAKGLMRFITVLDPAYLGLNTLGFITIEVEAPFLRQVGDALRDKPWLPYLFTSTGDAAIMGIIVARDLANMHDLIKRHIRTLDGVGDICSHSLLATYKVDVRWGVA